MTVTGPLVLFRPLGLRTALNQMEFPFAIVVPSKFDVIELASTPHGHNVVVVVEVVVEVVVVVTGRVVEVVDATGTVRLKKRVADADEMALDTRSTKTVRVTKSGS